MYHNLWVIINDSKSVRTLVLLVSFYLLGEQYRILFPLVFLLHLLFYSRFEKYFQSIIRFEIRFNNFGSNNLPFLPGVFRLTFWATAFKVHLIFWVAERICFKRYILIAWKLFLQYQREHFTSMTISTMWYLHVNRSWVVYHIILVVFPTATNPSTER